MNKAYIMFSVFLFFLSGILHTQEKDYLINRDSLFVNQYILNSEAADDDPIVSADGKVIFFSSSRSYPERWWQTPNYMGEGRYDFDIYYSLKVNNQWTPPVNIGTSINTPNDDAVKSISPDGQTIYFLTFKTGWENDGGPFYKAELHGTSWTNILGMGGSINKFFRTHSRSNNWHVSGASISPDGKEFYFSTELNPVYGSFDIWVSKYEYGIWGYPINLGSIINAKNARNYSPYMAFDDKTLFFSSDGYGGYGQQDVFFSTLRNGKWSLPMNVGVSINTYSSETTLSIPASGKEVYLVSNRPGGLGSNDIYSTGLPPYSRPPCVVIVTGVVTDAKTGDPLEAKIYIEDLSLGESIYSSWSNSETGKYTVVLQSGRHYSVTAEKKGYWFFSKHYNIPIHECENRIWNIALQPLDMTKIANIYFDFNKATLKPESKLELNRFIKILEDNPTFAYEISGHTDSVGTAEYNQKLSEDRANSVRDYLIETGGISANRLRAIGYGESMPIAENSNEEGRALNRRTEFKIVQY